jgi:putative photosynthetic complex assembly protein
MSGHGEAAFPRGALIGAGALVGFALLATVAVRTNIIATPPNASEIRAETGVAPLMVRELRFRDAEDGAVLIEDLDGNNVMTIAAGTENGFVRGVMRGLARERRMSGFDEVQPFRLTLWADNGLTLRDEATGREIELGAFGDTNRAIFAAMLPLRAETKR